MPRRRDQARSHDPRVPLARQFRRMVTPAERKLWWHFREAPLEGADFRRQAAIGPYFADFCCHTNKLVIEIVGGTHAEDQQMAADAKRTEYLEARGYRVLRFCNNDVLTNIEGVMTVIANILAGGEDPRAPHP